MPPSPQSPEWGPNARRRRLFPHQRRHHLVICHVAIITSPHVSFTMQQCVCVCRQCSLYSTRYGVALRRTPLVRTMPPGAGSNHADPMLRNADSHPFPVPQRLRKNPECSLLLPLYSLSTSIAALAAVTAKEYTIPPSTTISSRRLVYSGDPAGALYDPNPPCSAAPVSPLIVPLSSGHNLEFFVIR